MSSFSVSQRSAESTNVFIRANTSIQDGHSVLLHVTGFNHYFYVAAPIGFQPSDCNAYKVFLESESQKAFNQHSAVIHSVQMTMRENILRYQGNQKSPYLKITVNDPKMMARVRTLVQKNNSTNWKGLWPNQEGGILTFDNIAYELRFMIDTKVIEQSPITRTTLTS